MLKYKCLVLDHDDTVVNSTPEIHFPIFMEYLKKIRPDYELTLEDFMSYNFEPGFSSLCSDILKFSDEEMKVQEENWMKGISDKIPDFFDGFKDIIHKFKEDGGIIAVVSHSFSKNIKRDYVHNCGIEPDISFGWEYDEKQRKPYPFPLEEIMRVYNLQSDDILMVDDLKPGYDMAKKCNVDFAFAGWSYTIDKIKQFMQKNSDYYLSSVDELSELLFKK